MILETKFNINQTVFYLKDNKVVSSTIQGVHVGVSVQGFGDNARNHVAITYTVTREKTPTYEKDLFASKEELLASL